MMVSAAVTTRPGTFLRPGFDIMLAIPGFQDIVSTAPQHLINGLLVGAPFAAVAVGFALIWGVVDIINLAHGEMVMLGGYVTFWTVRFIAGTGDVSLLLVLATVPLAVIFVFVLGYIIQSAIVSRVTETDMFLTLLVTFGISILIQQLALQTWGANPRTISVAFSAQSINYAGVIVPKMKFVAFIGAIALTGLLWAFLKFTRRGRAIRAVSQNPQAAALLGIDVKHTRAITFGMSSAIAAGTGSLIATIFSLGPQMGLVYTLRSFIIVVFGGIGSIPGALIGGLALGSVEEFTAGYVGSTWTLAVSFTLLIVLLAVMPRGLFGESSSEVGE